MDSTLNRKKSFTLPSAYTVLLIITAVIALATQFIPGVTAAKFSDLIMAPINGLNEAIDIAIFVLLIGGYAETMHFQKEVRRWITSAIVPLQS